DGDAPRDRVLKPGERYIHVVRLSRWLVPPAKDRGFGLTNGDAPEGLFATGGDFKVTAAYAVERINDDKESRFWTGKVESKSVTVAVPKLGVCGDAAGNFRLRLR